MKDKLIILVVFILGLMCFSQKSKCGELNKKEPIIYIQDSTSTNKFKYDSSIDPLIINFIKSILENPDKFNKFEENFPELKCKECIIDVTESKNFIIRVVELLKKIKNKSLYLKIEKIKISSEISNNFNMVFNYYLLKNEIQDYYDIVIFLPNSLMIDLGFYKNSNKFNFFIVSLSILL